MTKPLVTVLGMKAILIHMIFFSEVGVSQNHVSSSSREFQAEAGKFNLLPSHLSIGVLQEIGQGCRSKVLISSRLDRGCLISLFLLIIDHLLMCRWSSSLL
jgi:hypothetical protein